MNRKLLYSLLIPGLLIIVRPLGMNVAQSIVLATLLATIAWWVTGVVNRTIASLLMLTVFSVLGNTPLDRIFQFPLSANFILIVLSFVFSEGIMNSGLADKLILPILQKGSRTIHQLLIMISALTLALIFVIPQPFSRIIILGMLLNQFFRRSDLEEPLIKVLLLYTFLSAVIMNISFLRGDIILNHAFIAFSQMEITELQWAKVMLAPSGVLLIVSYCMFQFLFRKELGTYRYAEKEMTLEKLTKEDKRNLMVIAAVVILWAAEPFHGVSATLIILMGTALMGLFKMITLKDLKAVNLELLLFITAAFSIGVVMNYSGIAAIVLHPLSTLLPGEFGITYVLVVMVMSMLMHMMLGSNITTLSVVIPSLTLMSAGVAPPYMLMFTIYVSVCAHYILPFHNVVILLGNGKSFYNSKTVAKFGIPLTGALVILILGIYYPWWKFIGLA